MHNDTGLHPQGDFILCEKHHSNITAGGIHIPDRAVDNDTDQHILTVIEDAWSTRHELKESELYLRHLTPGTRILVSGFRALPWKGRRLALVKHDEVVLTVDKD